MRILIAPDKFKGTLSAPAAALAIAEGVRAIHPADAVSLCPVADGGEGTLATLLDAIGGTRVFVSVSDPWGVRSRLPVALLDDGSACIESATAAGDPLRADSHGVGQALVEVATMAASARVLVGIGGTASTDGGTGLARALGWSFRDARGQELAPGGGALRDLDRIVPPESRVSVDVVGLCDVDAPLTGPLGSARCFAEQKGATPDQVVLLEEGLRRLADVMKRDLGIDVESVPGAGAGGGMGAGIAAFCGADLRSGFEFVAGALQLRSRIRSSDVVITGEGKFDEQSLQGKAGVGVARMSHEEGVPCLGLFGQISTRAVDALTVGFSDVATIPPPAAAAGAARDDPAARLAQGAENLIARQPL